MNLHSQLERKHMKLELAMGQREQSCAQNPENIIMEVSSLLKQLEIIVGQGEEIGLPVQGGNKPAEGADRTEVER